MGEGPGPERPAAKPQKRGESVVHSEAPAEEQWNFVYDRVLSAQRLDRDLGEEHAESSAGDDV